ncbi:LysR family transcriptional regulator [Sneathiella limimaris]|uniref:LysR family transcriptional regulator n=1 Tax=Sneathiella limimaris TaxID=1964213 RepID=UPI00146CEB1A|nr:LysR family transcriptional regulator [Sneathiella limimaris]
MPDRFETMSILISVIDAGSLTAGAKALRMPIATVSRRISDLEQQLGTELLLRSPRGLTLTDTGVAYAAACRKIIDEVNEAERAASGEFTSPKGKLTMTAPIVFGRLHVLPAINSFLMAYPEVSVDLEQTDRPVNLLEEHLDLAVRIGPLADSPLKARRLGEIRQVVVASPDYLENKGRPLKPTDLCDFDCISFRSLVGVSYWDFFDEPKKMTVPVPTRLAVNTAEAAVLAAEEGVGVTRVLCYQVADALRAGRLQLILEDYELPPWPVHMLYEDRSLIPQKIRAFLDFAAPRISKELALALV